MNTRSNFSSLLVSLALILGGCGSSAPPPAEESAPTPPEAPPVAIATPAEDCVLTMGWDPWEPYHFEDVDGSIRGLEIDLVQSIAAGADCRIEFERGPWDALLKGLTDGSIDLLGGATATSEREDFARFSAPYREESFRLFLRTGDRETFAGKQLADLLASGMRVGITQSYVYGAEVAALQDDPAHAERFIESSEAEFNFVALVENAVDGVLEDPYVASAILRRRGWQDTVEAHPLDLGSSEVSLMFSRASVEEQTVERFNRSLAALRASGELDRIIARYRID